MTYVVIPTTPGVPSYTQRTTLDGTAYILAFRWSMRESRWYLDIKDADGRLRAGCIKLVANFPLLASRRGHEGLPPGELIVVDARPAPADPGLDELGDVVHLLYREAA